MLATNGNKRRNETLRSVSQTLKEMLGPQTYLPKDSNADCEDLSTADYNSNGKEPAKNAEGDSRETDRPLEKKTVVKSAFNRVKDPMFPCGVNSMDFLFPQYHMPEDYIISNSITSMNNYQLQQAHFLQNKKSIEGGNCNLNFNNYNQPSGVFNSNPNNILTGSNNKPVLFTSVKNSRNDKERKNGSVNFQITNSKNESNKSRGPNMLPNMPQMNTNLSFNNLNKMLSNPELHLNFSHSNSNDRVANKDFNPNLTNHTKARDSSAFNCYTYLDSSTTNQNTNSNLQSKHLCSQEEYLDFLLIAADSLIEKGYTTTDELHSMTIEDTSQFTHPERVAQVHDESLLNRRCENKICTTIGPKKSGMWVKTKNKGKSAWLCDACHKGWKNNQFCFYCNVIYTDNSGNSNYNDTKNWVMCDYCEMWHHIQCEETKGFYHNLSELIEDSQFKYSCPLCRKSNETNLDPRNKRKYNYKKNVQPVSRSVRGCEKEFLGHKLKSGNYEYTNLLKFPNKRNNELDKVTSTGMSVGSFSNLSILNSNDNRDIYHDFYKIANITQEDKKNKI